MFNYWNCFLYMREPVQCCSALLWNMFKYSHVRQVKFTISCFKVGAEFSPWLETNSIFFFDPFKLILCTNYNATACMCNQQVIKTCVIFPDHIFPSISIVSKNRFKLKSCLVRWSCVSTLGQEGAAWTSLVVPSDLRGMMNISIWNHWSGNYRNVKV